MNRHWWVLAGIAAAAFSVVGCGSRGSSGTTYGNGGGKTATVGSACTQDSCGTGLVCDTSQPGGACTAACLGLDDCPEGSACITQSNGDLRCERKCAQDVECRVADGYQCTAVGDAHVCRGTALPSSSSGIAASGTGSSMGTSGGLPSSTGTSGGLPSSSRAGGSSTMTTTSSGTGGVCLNAGASCTTFNQCCSGTCADGVCGDCGVGGCMNCRVTGSSCTSSSECCSSVCRQGLCSPCAGHYAACSVSGECCDGNICVNGQCCSSDPNARDCGALPGESCGRDQDCRLGLECEGGRCCDVPGPEWGHFEGQGITSCTDCCSGTGCVEYWPGLGLPYLNCCRRAGGACTTDRECCSGVCSGGTCCSKVGEECGSVGDCCQGQSSTVMCEQNPDSFQPLCCVGLRQACTASEQCCEGQCPVSGNRACCIPNGSPSSSPDDCCGSAAVVGGKCCVGGGLFAACANDPGRCCSPLVCKNHPGASVPYYCDNP